MGKHSQHIKRQAYRRIVIWISQRAYKGPKNNPILFSQTEVETGSERAR